MIRYRITIEFDVETDRQASHVVDEVMDFIRVDTQNATIIDEEIVPTEE